MITRHMLVPEGLPKSVLNSLILYVYELRKPGSFLTAVLENDFQKAVMHADEQSLACLRRIAQFVYADLPTDCWGSPEKVRKWLYEESDDARALRLNSR